MKAVLEIYLERPLDEQSEEIYKTLTDEKVQEFFNSWKNEINNLLYTEIGEDIENVSINVKLINS